MSPQQKNLWAPIASGLAKIAHKFCSEVGCSPYRWWFCNGSGHCWWRHRGILCAEMSCRGRNVSCLKVSSSEWNLCQTLNENESRIKRFMTYWIATFVWDEPEFQDIWTIQTTWLPILSRVGHIRPWNEKSKWRNNLSSFPSGFASKLVSESRHPFH